MNYRVKMVLVLIVVGAFSGGSLSSMYNNVKAKIEENMRKEIELSLSGLLPCASYEEKEWKGKRVFICRDEKGKITGYAIIGEGEGFQGKITLMLGMDKETQVIRGIDILESQETPGLGAKIDDKEFKSQFRGKRVKEGRGLKVIKMRKPQEGEIEAITGATISSQAVTKLVNELVKEIQEFREGTER